MEHKATDMPKRELSLAYGKSTCEIKMLDCVDHSLGDGGTALKTVKKILFVQQKDLTRTKLVPRHQKETAAGSRK